MSFGSRLMYYFVVAAVDHDDFLFHCLLTVMRTRMKVVAAAGSLQFAQ
jgi:hypothetical protein